MTTATKQADEQDSKNASSPKDERVEIKIDELIVGRMMEHPIYDRKGILLLASQTVISSDIKKLLKSRNLEHVCISEEDADRVTMRNAEVEIPKTHVQIGTEISKKLDAIIDCGLLNVSNEGPAVKERVREHGREGYNEEQRERLKEQHSENSRQLTSMMDNAVNGQPSDGSVISQITSMYLKEMEEDTDNVLTSAIDAFQEDSLSAHAMESSLLAMAIGIEMGQNETNIRDIGTAGLVHDWGMMRVPEDIRNAPRFLRESELHEIRKHPIYSLEMLQKVTSMPRCVPIVSYQIHEKCNGSGYPRHRTAKGIHPFAKIIQVADAYIAITSKRPHRRPLMRYGAMECLLKMVNKKLLDPLVVRALLKIQSLFPIGSYISLSDGSVAKVIRRNKDNYSHPIIQIVQHSDGTKADATNDENLIDLAETELSVEQAVPTPGSEEMQLTDEIAEAYT